MVDPKTKTKPARPVRGREERWATARRVFETTQFSARDMARLMGVTVETVREHARREEWAKSQSAHAASKASADAVDALSGPEAEPRARQSVDPRSAVAASPADATDPPARGAEDRREDVVSRLRSAIALQVDDLEARFKAHGADGIERDVKTLGVLAKTVETLMLIDRRRTDPAATQDNEVDLERARAEIAQRLDRLRAR